MVTGGAGFIGSALIRYLLGSRSADVRVVNVDKLTYAGDLESLHEVSNHPGYHFEEVDVCDAVAMRDPFERYQPDGVVHLAAESHVDRSIDDPGAFVETNIVGTATLLEMARAHWSKLGPEAQGSFRFHHVSTDEVYGSLGRPACSRKIRPTGRIHLTRPVRRPPTIWSGPGMRPMACRCSSPTARTTTGHTSFRSS